MIYPAVENYIDFAVESLKEGNIIVYPTDTLYGFGVDAENTDAIRKLNQLKGRAQPLSIIIQAIDEINNYGYLESVFESEILKIFPGKYTILLQAKTNKLSPLVQNGSTKIGIRIPDHFFPINLVKLLGRPIITTSINRHGKDPLNNVTQVEIDFPNIDIFEDQEHSPSIGSTIIDYSNSPPVLIRQGDGLYPL